MSRGGLRTASTRASPVTHARALFCDASLRLGSMVSGTPAAAASTVSPVPDVSDVMPPPPVNASGDAVDAAPSFVVEPLDVVPWLVPAVGVPLRPWGGGPLWLPEEAVGVEGEPVDVVTAPQAAPAFMH